MGTWDDLLAGAGFTAVDEGDDGAWDDASVDGLDLGAALGAAALGLRLSEADAIDAIDLDLGLDDVLEGDTTDAAAVDGGPAAHDLEDLHDLTGARSAVVLEQPLPEEGTPDPGDDSELTMTGDVVGFEADPDAFAAVLAELSDVDAPVVSSWPTDHGGAHGDEHGAPDVDDADGDVDDDPGGDWHIPR